MLSAQITNPAVGVIDTVERLQGGERPTIIVSGTASDPAAIASNARFLLDLNRSNVAFSRAQERLVVVCSRSLLDALPAELEDYHAALLWKSLRSLCTRQVAEGQVSEATYEVYTVPRELDH
jgi:superfamily I DNA and/or RNA helicase